MMKIIQQNLARSSLKSINSSFSIAVPLLNSSRHFSTAVSWNQAISRAESLVQQKGSVINPAELLGNDFEIIADNIRKLLGTGHPVLNTISSYYFNKKGKHIRPLIILLISQASFNVPFNYTQNSPAIDVDNPISPSSDIYFPKNMYSSTENILTTQRRLAEIVEMIHTASLLHDDVIDESLSRRGQPSANAKYGNKMAVLAGDFLLSRASVALARLHHFQVIELIANIISNLVEGEFMQLRNSMAGKAKDDRERWKNAFDYYLEKTYLKTASLIAKSCRAAVLLRGSSEQIANAAFEYGKNIGIAFQLVDDMLDFTSSYSMFGKPVNADLNLGLATAPVYYATEEYPELWPLIDRKFSQRGDVYYTLEQVMKSKGIEKTKQLASKYTENAIKSISVFPESPARDALIQLANSIIEREK